MRHDSKLLFEIKIMFSILIQLVNKIFNITNETRNFLIHLPPNQIEIKMIDIIKNQAGLILPSGIRVRYFSDSIVVEHYHPLRFLGEHGVTVIIQNYSILGFVCGHWLLSMYFV